jgi:hypothetical protein
LLLSGCSGPKSEGGKGPKANIEPKEESRVVNTASGNATGYTVQGPRQALWKVQWDSARIIMEPDGNTLSQMKGAKGSFLKDGAEASTFDAANGIADKSKGDIDVSGDVVVVSKTRDATLRCDKVHYSSKGEQIVRATGNVSVEGKWGTVGGLKEVWATPDLKVFGTPDLFQKQ